MEINETKDVIVKADIETSHIYFLRLRLYN